MRRRRFVAVGLTGAVVLGLCGAALHPYLRGQIESRASARLGVPVHVASLSIGLTSVSLQGVTIGAAGSGLSGSLGTVLVEPGPLSLALGGTGSIASLTASDVSVRASVSGLRTLYSRGRVTSARHAAHVSNGGRELRLRNVHMTLEDEHGDLARIGATALSLDRRRAVSVEGGSATVGGPRGGELVVEGVTARGSLAGSARLSRLDVGSGHVVAVEASVPGVRTWSRVRGVFEIVHPLPGNATTASRGGEASDGVVSDSGVMDEDAADWRDSSAAEVAVRSPGSPTSDDDRDASVVRMRESGTPDGPGISSELLARLGALLSGAELSVAEFEIRVHRPTSDRVVVRELFGRVSIRSEGIHLDGHGVADTGGGMRWDLTLHPAQTRGEGSISAAELPLDLFSPLFPSLPLTHPERGRLSFNLELRSSGADVDVEGDLTLRNAEFTSDAVAGHPVAGLSIAAQGRATWSPSLRRLSLEHMRLGLGRAAVLMTGMVEAPVDHYAANLVITLPPTECADALGAVPRDLLDDVADFALEGRIAARVGLELDSRHLAETQLRVHVADGCRFVSVPGVADLRRVGGPFVHRVREPDGSVFEMTTGPGTANWTPIPSISPFLVHAVVAHEDSAFFRHSGFAPWAIRDALIRDLEAGRYVTGASTITMQLAKNLFLQREKTLARKAQEVILTWWLEAARSKQEILELYLNLIEYGPGIYGIRAASEHYFGREPVALSAAEAAFLASILPAPKRFHAQYVAGALSHSMRNRMRRLLERMAERGRIDQAALEDGRSELGEFRFARPGAAVSHVAAGGYAALSWTTDLDETAGFEDVDGTDTSDGERSTDEDDGPPQ